MKAQLLIAMALVAVAVVPANAEQGAACDNRSFFERLLTTVPEDHPRGGERFALTDLSAHERARLDAAVTELTAQVGSLCLAQATSEAEEGGAFPAASDHYMLYEFFVHEDEILCNQGYYVGNGGHYEIATQMPDGADGMLPWSDGRTEYLGVAQSDLSSRDDGVKFYGQEAYYLDVSTGKGFAYSQPIAYGGVSDFYCFAFEIFFVHVWAHFNIPVGTGIVAPAGLA